MLLNVKREERYHIQYPLGAFLGVTILTEVLLLAVQQSFSKETATAGLAVSDGRSVVEGNTEAIGDALYSTYLFPFEVASLILLVAMIGAIILAKRDLFETVQRS
jgi:NADH-quinone oxidoreductase subunit J